MVDMLYICIYFFFVLYFLCISPSCYRSLTLSTRGHPVFMRSGCGLYLALGLFRYDARLFPWLVILSLGIGWFFFMVKKGVRASGFTPSFIRRSSAFPLKFQAFFLSTFASRFLTFLGNSVNFLSLSLPHTISKCILYWNCFAFFFSIGLRGKASDFSASFVSQGYCCRTDCAVFRFVEQGQ